MTATLSPATSLDRLLGTVGEAMTGEVIALEADTPADIAIRWLEQTQVSGAPVLDHGRMVGLVTVRADPIPSTHHRLPPGFGVELETIHLTATGDSDDQHDGVLMLKPCVDQIAGVIGVLSAWGRLHAVDRHVWARDREVLVPKFGEDFLSNDQLRR
jgi:hypothetical protein